MRGSREYCLGQCFEQLIFLALLFLALFGLMNLKPKFGAQSLSPYNLDLYILRPLEN